MISNYKNDTHPEIRLILISGYQILERYRAICNENIGGYGSVMKNGESERFAVLNCMLKLFIPDGIERFLFGRCSSELGVVHHNGNVRVQRLLICLSKRVPSGAIGRSQTLSLAYFHTNGARKHDPFDAADRLFCIVSHTARTKRAQFPLAT